LGISVIDSENDSAESVVVQKAISDTVAKFGHLDAVVLSAGIGVMGSIANGMPSDWPKLFSVNLFGMVTTLNSAIPHLRESPKTGRIVLMSSGLGVSPLPGLAAYSAAKAAVNSLVRFAAGLNN
jgi:NAD(P)-dependent dehydrogenase (short-subunit alcohol dehydrogenase family)